MLGWATAIALVALAAGIGARDARATLIFKLETVLEEAASPKTEELESESNTEDGFEFMCSLEKHEEQGDDEARGMLAGVPVGAKSFAASFGQSLLSGPKAAGPRGRGGPQQGGQGGGSNGTGPGGGSSSFSRGHSGTNGPTGGGPTGGGPTVGGPTSGAPTGGGPTGGSPNGGGPNGGGPTGGDPTGGDPPGLDDPDPTGPTVNPVVAAPVPEPSTLLMGGLASLIGLGLSRMRRSKNS